MPRLASTILALSLSISPVFAAEAKAPDLAAEVDKGVKAFNAREIAYYEQALLPDAVLIADDGAVFAGKERLVKHFARVFGMTPAREIAVTDVTSGGRGDAAWARFKWTLTGPDASRAGVTTTLYLREGGAWKVALVQNTRSAHGAPAAAPHKH